MNVYKRGKLNAVIVRYTLEENLNEFKLFLKNNKILIFCNNILFFEVKDKRTNSKIKILLFTILEK
jgi:hypothetical protein